LYTDSLWWSYKQYHMILQIYHNWVD